MAKKTIKIAGEGGAEKAAPSFTVEQLLSAKSFVGRKDALIAATKPGKRYTVAEAVKLVNEFLERKV